MSTKLTLWIILLEEILVFMFNFVEQHDQLLLEILTRYCKEPYLPWKIHAKLSWQCQEIITSLDHLKISAHLLLYSFTCFICWHPLDGDITLEKIFVGIDIDLTINVWKSSSSESDIFMVYITVVSNEGAWHLFYRLLAPYPK